MKKLLSFILLTTMCFSIFSCNFVKKPQSLTDKIEKKEIETNLEILNDNYLTAFSSRLFKECYEKDNTLISPLSVISALAMVQNGAEGETLTQMETVLGADRDTLNNYIFTYHNNLNESGSSELKLANSLWIKNDESLTVKKDFLQKTSDYFSADVFTRDFDSQTKREINGWVKENTNKMIPEIINEIPPQAVMYLINALAFEAEWQYPYEKHDIKEDVFTLENGSTVTTDFMHCTEHIYIFDENTEGFAKYYKGHKYAFVALLPDEELTISEYIEGLTEEKLTNLLNNRRSSTVVTSLPKFETEYENELSDILKNLGMNDIFDAGLANLSSLGSYLDNDLYVTDVFHKTHIKVDAKGTKAGAATAVAIAPTSSGDPIDEVHYVYLDRPFVYLIIDCKTNSPIFIGALCNP